MGYINVSERTIHAKLVYYGVGVGGKTTSLQHVHSILCPRNEVQLVSINTEEDSTLLFDFLPINLGSVGGYKVRIQGFTVPGQPKYRQMRKYVLTGADAVVFVVDSQRSRLQENLESLQSLKDNLAALGPEMGSIPIVVQYNKRDLADVLPEAELDQHFRLQPAIDCFPSVATDGQGVFEAFVHATSLMVEQKVHAFGLGRGDATPADVASGVRTKLWALADERRRDRERELAEPKTTKVVLRDEPPRPQAAQERTDETDFRYELRDELPRRKSGPVFRDEELSVDLGPLQDAAPSREPRTISDTSAAAGSQPLRPAPLRELPPLDLDTSLLDHTVQSNLELAYRFGELDEYRHLLERKVRELVESAQNTVHDLKRPISVLRLMLSSLQRGLFGDLEPKVHQAIQNGLMAVGQMERLTRDLIDSSRLDHDGISLKLADVDLSLLVASVLQAQRAEIEQKDIRFRVEPLPVVTADEWALTRLFHNLVGNAIQYTSPGRQPVISVRGSEVEDQFHVVVEDNGIGIPAGDRERLFRRFERGSNTGGISGTGLGLHIVREIARAHGGTVTVESEEGAWTRFTVVLPRVPVAAPHSKVSETAEAADL